MKEKLVWIALVNVRQSDRNSDFLEGGEGAWVNVVGPSVSSVDFTFAVETAAKQLGLIVLDIEKPELFRIRAETFFVEPLLHELADEAENTDTVRFGCFHIYPKETDLN